MRDVLLSGGVRIPQLGLGVYQTPAGEQTENAVLWALEAGYRHIDAAMIYRNERSVGAAMRRSGVPRGDIFLTTKLWNEDIRWGRARAAFEESLAALNTDYIDLYLIHWPVAGYESAWSEMEALYEEGRIKAIGVSNFQAHHIERLEKSARIPPCANQIESHPYFCNQELISYCQGRGIAVEVWSPLGGTGGSLLNDEALGALAAKYAKSPAQIVLRWDIQRGVIVIPKSTHKERIVQNADIFDFVLSDEDMEKISALNRGERVGADPDNFNF